MSMTYSNIDLSCFLFYFNLLESLKSPRNDFFSFESRVDDSVPTLPQAKNGAMITLQVSPRSILTCFLFTKPLQDAQIRVLS